MTFSCALNLTKEITLQKTSHSNLKAPYNCIEWQTVNHKKKQGYYLSEMSCLPAVIIM